MGLIINSPITTPSGLEINSAYLSIYNRYIQVLHDDILNKKKLIATIRFYKDYSYRNTNNFFYFDDIIIYIEDNDLVNPYTHVYNYLKEKYPNSIDFDL
jgi:hypothetical protein